ncbi:phospholipase D-like domain-containing protein [Streptomyces nigra]|uniref:phospholipase D-like domain-containing protein n=1 Tax=Streptomyces nigra TaxID=1827580 RepID=UPI00380DBEED
MQVLRTLTCKGVYSFLPGREFTVTAAAYRNAIRRARHYLHIEDQYLWPSPLVEDLRDAAGRGVQLILVTARDFDAPGLKDAHEALRTEALQRIASAAPANVHCFHLEQAASSAQIYVHTKLMIVDDQYWAARRTGWVCPSVTCARRSGASTSTRPRPCTRTRCRASRACPPRAARPAT